MGDNTGMRLLPFAALALVLAGCGTQPPLVTGKWITPEGTQQPVGSFPANLALSPDGRYAVATNTGFRQQLSVLDADSGELVSRVDFNGKGEALYYGLAFARQGERTLLFASRGAEDLVSVFELTKAGKLEPLKDLHDPAPKGSPLPHHVAGLATNADGTLVYAVNNQTHAGNDYRGSLSVIDVATDRVVREIPLDGFPLAATVANGRVFVSSERDGLVTVVDPEAGTVLGKVATGSLPAYLKTAGDKVYASNSGSDTVSEIDPATLRVTRTILLRPAAYRGLPGSTPLGMDATPDGKRLFVAMADLDAVAVVDLAKGELEGYLPAGWYPTSVIVSEKGDRLLVANAKGTKLRNPNGSPVRGIKRGQYGAAILEGTVASLDLSQELGMLKEHTVQVLQNNRADGYAERTAKAFKNPGIRHIVYIVKENRTYDQILGDIPRGNGDPALTLFGRDVTPNQHALAERFALLDDFYVCAEGERGRLELVHLRNVERVQRAQYLHELQRAGPQLRLRGHEQRRGRDDEGTARRLRGGGRLPLGQSRRSQGDPAELRDVRLLRGRRGHPGVAQAQGSGRAEQTGPRRGDGSRLPTLRYRVPPTATPGPRAG